MMVEQWNGDDGTEEQRWRNSEKKRWRNSGTDMEQRWWNRGTIIVEQDNRDGGPLEQ